MLPLISPKGLSALKSLGRKNVLYGFDFDGTIAPLVDDFSKVKIPRSTQILLENFASRHRVAIISGRSLKDLKSHLHGIKFLSKISLVGNHGLEGPNEGLIGGSINDWHKELKTAVGSIQGVVIENKRHSLTVHYRLAKEKAKIRRKVIKTISTFSDKPRIIAGKLLFNLLPNLGFDKGTSFLALMEKLKLNEGVFIGDDTTDEDVFKIKKILSIRIGQSKKSYARFYINDQKSIDHFLRILNGI